MNDDVRRQVLEIIRDNPLAQDASLAMDASPVSLIKWVLDSLARKWVDRFINKALPVSDVLVKKTTNAVDRGLLASARADGLTINMQWTQAMTEKVDAIIAENVSLIRSIPEKYFTEVEGMVYRAVARGGDRKALADEIEANFGKRHGITRRRAEGIARDQVRKATASLSRQRQKAAGIKRGIWIHSGGSNRPRKKHVHAHGQEFDLDVGLPVGDKGQYVLPGEEVECGCTWKPVLPF
ncbi:phage head morphogenesis protein [Raoultella sp. Lac2]|nr:phage head morphogenesis protein [Raoultella sp. Lac2]MXF99234.1 phage head morphogenesis protein [Raoultella sp. Lac1]